MESADPLKTEGVDVRPTLGDRVLSGLGLLGIVVSLVWVASVYTELPERVAMHFNLRGEADDYSGKAALYGVPTMLGFVWFMLFMLSEHMPAAQMNLPVDIDDTNRDRAYVMSKRLLRVVQSAIGLTTVLLTGHLIRYNLDPVAGQAQSRWVMILVLVLVVAPVLVYFVRIRKTRKA